jgi:hypothetical protein
MPLSGGGEAGSGRERDVQAEADALLDRLTADLSPTVAAHVLALVSHRGVVRLHVLARAEASASKSTAAWPAWAQLQNAARSLVLQASTCRDLAQRLPPQPPPPPAPAPAEQAEPS